MPLHAMGVEHQTAPLRVREVLSLDGELLAEALHNLAGVPAIHELVILSTCNRTEFYFLADSALEGREAVERFLSERAPSVHGYLQTWSELDAVHHLFRIAAGLESQVLGEVEILGQVREALERAQAAETTGPIVHGLFRSAISCGRQVRAGAKLRTSDPSLATAAVRALEEALHDLARTAILVVGGGAMAQLVAGELRRRNVGTLLIANRTPGVAVELAERHGGHALALAQVGSLAGRLDGIITATSARQAVLTPEMFAADVLRRRASPLQIVDLAVPRDVDPVLGSMAGVTLRDLEDLAPEMVGERKSSELAALDSVIAAEAQEFMAWYLTRRAAPVIANLRSHVEAVQQQELRRVRAPLRDLTAAEWAAVESLTQRLVDKMFHHLVLRLRLAAQTDPKLVEAAEFFFLHGEGGLFSHAGEMPGAEGGGSPRAPHARAAGAGHDPEG